MKIVKLKENQDSRDESLMNRKHKDEQKSKKTLLEVYKEMLKIDQLLNFRNRKK